jgi:flagellar hook-basal body complex protein FliE
MSDATTSLSPVLARYARAADLAREGGGDAAPAASFGALLEKVLEDAVEAGQAGERAATRAVVGQADLQDVVAAINAAEVTLQTVVAVRDRMISAYQDIIRMPI